MMMVRHVVRSSPIAGLGIFADEDIAAGTIIWRHSPHVELAYSQAQWETLERELSAPCFEQVKKYSYKRLGVYYFCIDNSQFMNHGVETSNTISDNENNLTIAKRDIARGEEIVCNYYEFCDADDHNVQMLNALRAR